MRRPGRRGEEEGEEREFVVQTAQNRDEEQDPGVALVKTLATKAFQSNKVKSAMGLWLLGLFFMILSPAFKTTTPEMKQNYESMVIDAANIPEYEQTYVNWAKAQAYTDEVKVWFWRFREPYSSQVKKRQEIATKWQNELDRLDTLREQKMKAAKAYVGLFSEYGMTEVRKRFWDAYDKGKLFAQQQTFYHMLLRVLSGQDEEFLSTILNWVFVALVNFTTGLLGSLFYFFFSLIGMIYSYQPDPLSATAFFVLGFIGASSVIASYLFAIYGMVASGIYVVGKMVIRDALEQEQRQRLQQHQHQY